MQHHAFCHKAGRWLRVQHFTMGAHLTLHNIVALVRLYYFLPFAPLSPSLRPPFLLPIFRNGDQAHHLSATWCSRQPASQPATGLLAISRSGNILPSPPPPPLAITLLSVLLLYSPLQSVPSSLSAAATEQKREEREG